MKYKYKSNDHVCSNVLQTLYYNQLTDKQESATEEKKNKLSFSPFSSAISAQISSGQRANKWQSLRIIISNQFSPFSLYLSFGNNTKHKHSMNSCNVLPMRWSLLWFCSVGNTKKNKNAFISFIAIVDTAAAADWSISVW